MKNITIGVIWTQIVLQALLPVSSIARTLQPANNLSSETVSPGSPFSVDRQNNGQSDDADNVLPYSTTLSQGASMLAAGNTADSARSLAVGAASGELQQWLSQFGTARIQLGADKHFSLKNSQFDLLIPMYERYDLLAFTQGSMHRTDDRSQANLGTGIRHFYNSWMFGANAFLDYDLSRDHARAGTGLEYWRDFLKLGLNGYTPLTGWKDSPDLNDYQERPARGWDMRAQAWLPSLPQLGGELTYEQYYGRQVALFGTDNRQHNPRTITAGLDYTPVPLITISAEQRHGQNSQSDTRVGVELNYRLGVPWRNQVDPAEVAAMRRLAGSRYDLVERNNNIVLEYRKKETLQLHTADLITGHAGDEKSLRVSVTSTYGLSHIDWDASALNAAGGKIVKNGEDYAVVLPVYQSALQAVNTYTISGVAVDTKANRSAPSHTQVTVLAPEVSKQYSTFTPVSSVLPADGKSTQELNLTLRDANNQAVDIDMKDISLKNSRLKSATVSALIRKSSGVYTVTVTAGTDRETVNLTPTVSGITLSSASVAITSPPPDAGQSVFTANPETIVADNAAISTLTLVVKDAQGNPLTGMKDSLTFAVKDSSGKAPASGVITKSAITESSIKGTYTATMKGTVADKYTVVPEYAGTAMGRLSATVSLTAITPDEKISTIKTDNTRYVSGDDMTVVVTLKDSNNNPLTGSAGLLTTTAVKVANATLKSGSNWRDNGDGTYTATYTAGAVGNALKATMKLSGWSENAESASYAIVRAVESPKDILVNGYTFASDAGFPKTGFKGANFTLELKSGNPSDYTWQADASWVSVSNGVASFTGTGNNSRVTITGTPKNGTGAIIEYSFSLNAWFTSYGLMTSSWTSTSAYCSSRDESLPAVQQLNGSASHSAGSRGALGGLWSEWGDEGYYDTSLSSSFAAWTSGRAPDTASGSAQIYVVSMHYGEVYISYDIFQRMSVWCRKGL